MTKTTHISTLRLNVTVAEILADGTKQSPTAIAARENFSAALRAATDAFIASGGEVVGTYQRRQATGVKADLTPRSVSMPIRLHKHYKRCATRQRVSLSALYNSALLAALQS